MSRSTFVSGWKLNVKPNCTSKLQHVIVKSNISHSKSQQMQEFNDVITTTTEWVASN